MPEQSAPPTPGLSVAVDTGGTFTDVILLDRGTGQMWAAKKPSTPSDPSIGFMDGVGSALAEAGADFAALAQVFHGTTVATNVILEAKGAVAACLTNTGFRYLLEIGRHDIPRHSNLFSWIKPERPIPPERIFEIGGLTAASGETVEPLDEDAVRAAVRRARAQGVTAIAICFLHSYANSAHERRARDIILEDWPDAMVSLSSEVLPVFREFERSVATILNAYVMPSVSTYVGRLEQSLADKQVAAPLRLMKSNGGVAGAQVIRREPVQTALSGPAAGVVGTKMIAALAGIKDVIGVDIGGTSADISLIQNGQPGMTIEGKVGDWPLTLPMVDIKTIGAGGGSIARVSPGGVLSVGPESAGARPGPVCYGRGGTEPTVTDAHAVLGHLPPALLNGAMHLDVEAARAAIDERIARPLGFTVEDAARGILTLIDNTMVGAIRVVSVEKGHDPRDFALMPFGGAGPLHGGALARLLGVRTIIVPPAPGVLSALGLLASNLKSDFSRTCLQHPQRRDPAQMEAVFKELETAAWAWLDAEAVPREMRSIRRTANLRYFHQGFELVTPWRMDRVDDASIEMLVADFHQVHHDLYGFAHPDAPVEIVTLHIEAFGTLPALPTPQIRRGGTLAEALVGHHLVHFATGTQDCPLYDRIKLGAGVEIEGPAILMQLDTTTLILPGQTGTVDDYGNVIVREADGSA